MLSKRRLLRVCHIITQLELGGAQENTLATVERLSRDRYETELICGPGGMLDARARSSLGTRCHFVPSLVRPVCPVRDTLAFFALLRLIREGRYDIVHTHSSKAGILGRPAATLAGVPLILHTAHGWGFHDGQSWPVRSAFVAAERFAARRTDILVAVSHATVEKGLAVGVGRREQYAVIRSGIDPRPFREPVNVQELRGRLGLDPTRPLAGMVACLKPQKAPLDFLDIAARVRRDLPNAQFVLAGDGELRGPMEATIDRLGLRDVVRMLGWRNDIPDLIRAMDVLILTSRWEGMPRVFLEATAAGVPIVATNVDGAKEVVTDGVNGFLFYPGDASGMAECVRSLLSDSARLSALRASTASAWREEFDISAMVRHIDGLYQEHFQSEAR